MTDEIHASVPERPKGRDLTASPSRRYIRLGSIQVDLQEEEVTKDGFRLSISGKPYQVLITLPQRPRQIVPRDVIRDGLWPFAECANYDAKVNAAVRTLRRELGDNYQQPLYIKTIRDKGYLLMGDPDFADQSYTSREANTPQSNLSHPGSAGGWIHQPSARFWSVAWAIGIVLIGMLVGTWMSAFWISHHR
jgi:DNA-binding winged helix-turn-helix (wHTH) protein